MAATETLLTVRTEVLARGFEQLTPTRANRLINDAYAWLVNKALWPFRDTTVTQAPPITINDLGLIGSVTDTANGNRPLTPLDRRTLLERYGDITTAGTPCYFYVEGKSVVKAFPTGGTLAVRYWKKAAKLTADGDVLIVPDDWVQLVIDRACYRAYLDDDNFAAARELRIEIMGEDGTGGALMDMMRDLLRDQVAQPEQVEVYGGEGR